MKDSENTALPTAEPKSIGVLTNEDKRELMLDVKKTKTAVMDPIEYQQIRILADDLIKSKALPSTINNREQAIVMISAGREMGMSPYEAIHDLYFVNGQLNMYGKGTPAALRRAGWRVKKFEETDGSCTATVFNPKTGEEITDTFTFRDAEQSGFTTDSKGHLKFGWKLGANRKRKLRYGVLSQIIHTYIPEVLGSCAGVGDYAEEYIEAQDNATKLQEAEGKAKKLSRLQDLAETEGAEVVDENN
ncbi:MAG: hypothetical protein NC548_27120 [Lachnospiraceae bacterium]|nr:hypothetical protein [Lachnospiraceae bacterium]